MTETRRFPWEYHGDLLVVETPEQTKLELRVASFGARMGAALIDNLLIGLVIALLVLLAIVTQRSESSGFTIAFVLIAWYGLTVFYFVVYEARTSGRTLGKRLVGLRTVLATGQGVTLGPALVRNLARVVDNLPPFWLVPAMTKGSRRCGDLLAGTFVIDERPAREVASGDWLTRLAPSWHKLEDRHFAFGAQHAAALHPDDLNLIEYLDGRIRALPGGARRRALREIAERYVSRLELTDQRDRALADPGRFLQELGLFLRARFDEQAY